MKQPPPNKGATFRAILIGILLIPFNAYWIMDSVGQGYPTTVSLYFNVIFCIFWLAIANIALIKLIPRYALSQGEILTVYIMLSLSSSLAGHDVLRVLIPMIPHAFWYATPENEWAELFHRYIPDWVAIKDKNQLLDYYRGESTLYIWDHVKAWMTPTLAWSGFLFSMVFVMLCINIIVRRQWTEHEKLSYPIIQLPLEMTRGGGVTGALRSNLLWIGFGIAAGIDIINGLNFLYPNVPSLGGKLYDIRPYFTTTPWNAIGWTPVALFPFAVGLAFFIPLDLAFSCWFFYIFWKVERIMGAAIGVRSMPGFPFIDEQSFGAYIGLCIIAIITTRKHLWNVIRRIFIGARDVDDSREPLPYRWAFVGMVLAFGYIFGFSKLAGMSTWVVLAFFAIYYMISTAVTRMRAELGSPVHDLHFIGPDEMLPRIFGTRRLGPQNLTMFAYYFFFNRAYRGHPMPHMLEGFKLAERTRIDNRKLVVAMILAMALGIIATFWAHLHISYIEGGRSWFAWRPFNRLQSWLVTPRNPDRPATAAMVIGLGITLFLMIMRMRIFWWPLHPAGFAISSSWSMNVFWFSIFVSSLIKWFILKQGGLKTHRKAIPFFMGLILGEFIIGSIWALIGITIERPMYRFLY
jgi:hypothetical protein